MLFDSNPLNSVPVIILAFFKLLWLQSIADVKDGHIWPYKEDDNNKIVDSNGISDQFIEEVIAKVELYGRGRCCKTATKLYNADKYARTWRIMCQQCHHLIFIASWHNHLIQVFCFLMY